MTKILVIGAAGRMGRTIVSCIDDIEGVEISGGTENPGNSLVGSDIGELAGIGKKNIMVEDGLEKAVQGEKLFLDRLTLKVWKARREGSVVGAAYVLGVGFLLYLILDVGLVDPMSSFLYAGIAAMTFLFWQRVCRKP